MARQIETRWIALLLLTLVGLLLCLGGCEAFKTQDARVQTMQQAAHIAAVSAEGAQQAVDFYTAKGAEIDAKLATVGDAALRDDLLKAKARTDELIAKYRATFDQSVATVRALDAEIQKADNDGDLVVAAVNAAAPWIPGPWGGIVQVATPLIVGLIGMIFGKKKGKQEGEADAQAIAAAIESAKSDAGVVNFADPMTVKILDAYLTEQQKKLVDAGQKLAA